MNNKLIIIRSRWNNEWLRLCDLVKIEGGYSCGLWTFYCNLESLENYILFLSWGYFRKGWEGKNGIEYLECEERFGREISIKFCYDDLHTYILEVRDGVGRIYFCGSEKEYNPCSWILNYSWVLSFLVDNFGLRILNLEDIVGNLKGIIGEAGNIREAFGVQSNICGFNLFLNLVGFELVEDFDYDISLGVREGKISDYLKGFGLGGGDLVNNFRKLKKVEEEFEREWKIEFGINKIFVLRMEILEGESFYIMVKWKGFEFFRVICFEEFGKKILSISPCDNAGIFFIYFVEKYLGLKIGNKDELIKFLKKVKKELTRQEREKIDLYLKGKEFGVFEMMYSLVGKGCYLEE